MSNPHSLNAFVRALDRQTPLEADDKAAILALDTTHRTFDPQNYLVREGEEAKTCMVLVEGYAYRQKLTSNGARQIVSIHIPGEAVDLQNLHLDRSDHNIQALTRIEVAMVSDRAMRGVMQARPTIAEAVFRTVIVEAAIYREWLLNNGRRDAKTRVAHLLCEFAFRLEFQGLGRDGNYGLPMTQEQLGDALGLTSVHVNRSLRALAEDGLIERDGRSIRFPDVDVLRKWADFDPRYLQLTERMRTATRRSDGAGEAAVPA